jgi:hypothetical protein
MVSGAVPRSPGVGHEEELVSLGVSEETHLSAHVSHQGCGGIEGAIDGGQPCV